MKEEFITFKNNYIIENNKLKEDLKNKDKKILELEMKLNKLLIEKENTINSNIFKDKNEINFIQNVEKNNNKKITTLKLLYDSNIEGENEKKLIDGYTNKNDIIVFVKTKKNKRFGGYAHETFEKERFTKIDKHAFLFSLDKSQIYKSKGNSDSIWRNDKFTNCLNSINFGSGTDLRIFHNFIKEKNYSNGFSSYLDNNEKYPLIDERYFEISFLEIYQIQFK